MLVVDIGDNGNNYTSLYLPLVYYLFEDGGYNVSISPVFHTFYLLEIL